MMTYLPALLGTLIPISTIALALFVLKSTKRKAIAEASTAEIVVVDSVRKMLNDQTDRVNAEIVRVENRMQFVELSNKTLREELGTLRDDNTKKTSRIAVLESENKSKDRRISTLEHILKVNGLTIPPQQGIGEPQT